MGMAVVIGNKDRQSIGSVLESQNGFGSGFDVLRWVLAFMIFYGHCKWLAGSGVPKAAVEAVITLSERGWSGYRRPFQVSLVPMFFALSGFLVTASAVRVREVKTFLGLRALRIFPALTVEVALSALILGPMLTHLTLGEYFTDRAFYTYFGNILGIVQFGLPGVFASNPVPDLVNANLWTLPGEFYCYLVTAGVMAAGAMYNRTVFTVLYAIASVVLIVLSLTTGYGLTDSTASTVALVYYFVTGCVFYLWRDEIPRDRRLFAVAAGLAYVFLYMRSTIFVAAIPVVYATVFLGLFHHDKLLGLRKADYSYGIYLYGFPITQALLAIFPSLHGHGNQLAIAATVMTLIFAALSWHFIEKPTLALKKYLTGKEKRRRAAVAPSAVAGQTV